MVTGCRIQVVLCVVSKWSPLLSTSASVWVSGREKNSAIWLQAGRHSMTWQPPCLKYSPPSCKYTVVVAVRTVYLLLVGVGRISVIFIGMEDTTWLVFVASDGDYTLFIRLRRLVYGLSIICVGFVL